MDHKKTKAFFEGRELRAYNIFGAHVKPKSVEFKVWAPHAQSISVIGTFNNWDEKKNVMKKDDQGIWSCTIRNAKEGDSYKYRVVRANGDTIDKVDPYAFYSELRPNNASIISSLKFDEWEDQEWMKKRNKGFDSPVNIYEMHVGSWIKDEDMEDFVHYDQIIEEYAINEIYLFRQSHQAAKIRVCVNDITRLSEFVGDGIIYSSPVGSTAYNYSSHGPILPIDSSLIALTPISPFRPKSLNSAILDDKSIIRFEILENKKRPVNIIADFIEYQDILEAKVQVDFSKTLTLLFDKDNQLTEKIMHEQFS